jgi:putative endonuclease
VTATGELGESFVAHWLKQQSWHILHRRWRSRWGEIDLIARSPQQVLAFIEVKTRSRSNWDEGGALAVNFSKQAKIQRTAELFLQQHPQWSDRPCRFDVALVACQLASSTQTNGAIASIQRRQPILWQGYRLTLIDYLENAF